MLSELTAISTFLTMLSICVRSWDRVGGEGVMFEDFRVFMLETWLPCRLPVVVILEAILKKEAARTAPKIEGLS